MANIMIVDDSAVMRRVLKSYFTQIGHTVVAEAGNGENALMYYDAFKPDLITLDITMPGADGIEIMKQLLKKNPEIKVIIVSSITKKTTIVEALTSGAKHYILKPFTFEKMVSAVRGAFGEEEIDKVIQQAEEDVDCAIMEENAESVLNEAREESEEKESELFFKSIKIEGVKDLGKEHIEEYKRAISDAALISPNMVTIDLCKCKSSEKCSVEEIRKIAEESFKEKNIKYVLIEPV